VYPLNLGVGNAAGIDSPTVVAACVTRASDARAYRPWIAAARRGS
jgi:hypothetical protein